MSEASGMTAEERRVKLRKMVGEGSDLPPVTINLITKVRVND